MPKPSDDNVLVNLSTRLHPDPHQARVLTEMHAAMTRADQALRFAGSVRPRVEDVLDRHAPDLPAALRPAVTSVLRSRRDRQDASPLGLPFDRLFDPLPPYLLHSPVLPGPVIADLWRLPLGLGDALTRRAALSAARLDTELRQQRQAVTAGVPHAAERLHDLVVHSGLRAALFPSRLSGVSGPDPVLERTQPHLGRHVTVRRVALPDGQTGWQVRWTFRLEHDWLPDAVHADTVGVDVGVHRAVTWADGQAEGHLDACGQPSDHPVFARFGDHRCAPADPSPLGFGHRLADAHLRHAEFLKLAGPLDRTLRHLLTYRTVALEATRWADLRRKDARGEAVVQAMTHTGVTDLAAWLRALSRLTGTRVMSVPAEGSSLTCSTCGRVGQRCRRTFTCAHCGTVTDADVNAARNHRLWALGQRRDLGVTRP